MATRRQLEANRANAKRSTGPKSAAGKARSKINAIKHGLCGATVVIGDEDPQEFDAFRCDLRTHFCAAGTIEEELVDHVAALMWRMRRIPRIEAALFRLELEAVEKQERSSRLRQLKYGDEIDRAYDDFSDEEIEEDAHGYFAELEKLRPEKDTPAEARRKQLNRALGEGLEKLPDLSRYNAALLNDLKRLLAMLISLQSARREAIGYQTIESIALRSEPVK